MAETSITVASAVILPETVEPPQPSEPSRGRPSPEPESPSKRRRLSEHIANEQDNERTVKPELSSSRRQSGNVEERKRGQRLFGSLLGTLSQSSPSSAQKRRLEIERKQQAKLRLQDAEVDEKKKQRLDALMEIRRKEQIEYKKQSMQIHHSNSLATARFLRTKAEPRLYYRPWELLPGDEARIKSQIETAKETIEEERSRFNHENPAVDDSQAEKPTPIINLEEDAMDIDESKTVGPEADVSAPHDDTTAPPLNTNHDRDPSAKDSDVTNPPEASAPDTSVSEAQAKEITITDEGNEVVLEGEEDTVIY